MLTPQNRSSTVNHRCTFQVLIFTIYLHHKQREHLRRGIKSMNEFAEAIAAMIMWPLTIYVIYALVHKKRIYEDNLGHFGKVAAMSYAILMSIGIFFIFVGFLYGILEIALNTSAIKNVNT